MSASELKVRELRIKKLEEEMKKMIDELCKDEKVQYCARALSEKALKRTKWENKVARTNYTVRYDKLLVV